MSADYGRSPNGVRDGAPDHGAALLTIAEMYEADRLAISGGVPGVQLMAAAGQGIARAIQAGFSKCRVLVLCGPGNNGGDGFVVARSLKAADWPVKIASLCDLASYKGDAAHHAGLWSGPVETLDLRLLDDCDLVVDALFGAGLTRGLSGPARDLAEAVSARALPVVAVDIPSGVGGDHGQVVGDIAIPAVMTVTFFRAKPGHYLYPGRGLCGALKVIDIGTPAAVLDEISPRTWANGPALWLDRFPWRTAASHKYTFGHALLSAGGELVGASVLAARSAQRVGAGLVTVACNQRNWPVLAAAAPSVMARPLPEEADYEAFLGDRRINAALLGPGQGVGDPTRQRVRAALAAGKRVVLDADALTSFAEDPPALFEAIRGDVVLTPHDGEFGRLFPDLTRGELAGDKLGRARQAAARAKACVLLKGADTVIAAPDGRAAINHNGPPELAKAGSGDVLAGLCVGLLAQGMPTFEAACAAAWLHGRAAQLAGFGLIAEDLADNLPRALTELAESRQSYLS